MTIPIDYIPELIVSLESGAIRNFVAQAKAKQVLREVRELPDNYPDFTADVDERVTYVAYGQLGIGCSVIEGDDLVNGRRQVMLAADILESVYQADAVSVPLNAAHCLVASMGFYIAGQFSRAFVLLRGVEGHTPAGRMISAFIRKNWTELIQELNQVQLASTQEHESQGGFDEWAITVCIARALSLAFEHILSGDASLLDVADEILNDALIIGKNGSNPAFWWITRLLRLMLRNYRSGSLWTVLPPFFGGDGDTGLSTYITLLATLASPTTELWESQTKTLGLVLDTTNRGGVVNLRTSAGKTRVAELAILQLLNSDPGAKVLYLAPFRSLAFELERCFSATMAPLGFAVSHIYGGSRFSAIDQELFQEGRITIATPEKAKAIFRAAPELFENVKLIIIDEGHLLGPNDREVRNEVFFEFLRVFAIKKGARILLLSAVLPNAEQLAEWLGGSSQSLVKSDWKPSTERFGKLLWHGDKVSLEWLGGERCFNPNFIEFRDVPKGKRDATRLFPESKVEAVAATAVRLSELGPVLIFAGQAQWVPSMVRSVLIALGGNREHHPWPTDEWKVFETVCREELGEGSLIAEAAQFGVILHSNKLPTEVRISIERLMSRRPPKILVATTTLGQGVNIGISSVIVSTTFIGEKLQITKRDFWNICGRAGRAFVDAEGKILVAVDRTRLAWQIRRDEDIADSFLSTDNLDRAESGLLNAIRRLISIGEMYNIPFEQLLELTANDTFDSLGEHKNEVLERLDWIDDQLLAMHIDSVGDSEEVNWIDDTFRDSLAAIQARASKHENFDHDVLEFLKSRVTGILRMIPATAVRRAVVSSSLPLSVARLIVDDLDHFRGIADRFLSADSGIDALTQLVREFEAWAREKAPQMVKGIPAEEVLDEIRPRWLNGSPMVEISNAAGDDDVPEICATLYAFQLPWLMYSVAQKLDRLTEEERFEAFSRAALYVELGLPSLIAAKIFMAGVRARPASVELADLLDPKIDTISGLRSVLLDKETRKRLAGQVSDSVAAWLEILAREAKHEIESAPSCVNFRLEVPAGINVLQARRLGPKDSVYLCSLDGQYKVAIRYTEKLPFDRIANLPGFVFIRDGDIWKQVCRNPRATFN